MESGRDKPLDPGVYLGRSRVIAGGFGYGIFKFSLWCLRGGVVIKILNNNNRR
jgi:hypothetical protein